MKDPYSVLGVKPDRTVHQRKLIVLKFFPDVFPDRVRIFS